MDFMVCLLRIGSKEMNCFFWLRYKIFSSLFLVPYSLSEPLTLAITTSFPGNVLIHVIVMSLDVLMRLLQSTTPCHPSA